MVEYPGVEPGSALTPHAALQRVETNSYPKAGPEGIEPPHTGFHPVALPIELEPQSWTSRNRTRAYPIWSRAVLPVTPCPIEGYSLPVSQR